MDGPWLGEHVSQRRRRHHTVPRFHLQGFASADGMLVHLDVSTGQRRNVSVTDATVIRDFYTVVLPDGTRSDAWEQWLGEIEGEVAPALKRAIEMPRFALTEADRGALALWIALQYLRGPDNRRQMAEIASFTVRAQVGMGGLAYLQHAMSQGLRRDVPLEEAEQVWLDITSEEGPEIRIAGDEHLEILRRAYERAAVLLASRSWGRMRFARHSLVLADAPVWRVRGDTPEFMGVGLANAPAITVPLDRQTMLLLSLPREEGPLLDQDLNPTAAVARAHNTAAVVGAERFVYFHPDDDSIPSDVELPRGTQPRLEVSGGADFANRNRPLADVLEQNANHVDRRGDSLIANYTWPIAGYVPKQY